VPAETRILVVEDDLDLRHVYRTVLNVEGYTVLEAGDGFQALRLLDSEPPDLVVLDLGLPRVSGLVVRHELAAQAHLRHIPVLVITGSTAPLDDLNVTCLLRKPVSPDALLRAIERCLDSPSGSGV
jgi:CheY-like chemotaxis protein